MVGALDITSGAITLQDITFDNNSTTTSYDDGGAIMHQLDVLH